MFTKEFIDLMKNDKNLQELKSNYKEKFKKKAPGFNNDEYDSYDDYKEYLRRKIEE